MTTKERMYETGVELMNEFCAANALEAPHVAAHRAAKWRFDACAYYRPTLISICVSNCAHIGFGGQAWSYPGYVIDRTPHGVIQHELGHHVDWHLSDSKGAYGGDFSTRLRQATGEQRITSYAPNDWEWFAEIFRLYVTNSDLLRLLRPRTYSVLREIYKPVVDAPWRKVLAKAPQRTIEQAEKKIHGQAK